MTRFFRFIGAILSTCAIFFGLLLLIDTYCVGIMRVQTLGIEGLIEHNDIIMVDKFSQNFKTLSRFDFLVFKHPQTGEMMAQRIIGLPGEKVDYLQNQLYINNTRMDEPFLPQDGAVKSSYSFSAVVKLPETAGVLPPQHYIVINDNRDNQDDSRTFGALGQGDIVGVMKARLFPFNRVSMLLKHYG